MSTVGIALIIGFVVGLGYGAMWMYMAIAWHYHKDTDDVA